MRQTLLLFTLAAAMLLACTGVVLAQQTSPSDNTSSDQKATPDVGTSPHLAKPGTSSDLCPGPVEKGKARCFSKKRTDIPNGSSVTPAATTVYGYHPSDLQSAYNLTDSASTNGSGKTVAIVDAYDDPNAESDLQTYRKQFNLPLCSSSNGCFTKVSQSGDTDYPSPDSGWAGEISLDMDMVSAICPHCNILLVEADSNSDGDLFTAVNEAASLGANAISNSYGGSEFSGEKNYDSSFDHPGIAITASAGDNGYGVQFPAASEYLTAVGGTSLTQDSSARGWSESVWGSSSGGNGTGSGCSAYISKPSWQHDAGCSRRTVGDVAADADPNTGVAVYDSYGRGGDWGQYGGTSASSPMIASIYALAGNTSSVNDGSFPYSHTSSLYDVTSGSNGSCAYVTRKQHGHKRRVFVPSLQYLCTGTTGYDGPTGNGTPNGTGAF